MLKKREKNVQVRHYGSVLNQSSVELNGSQGLDSCNDCMQSSTIISRRLPSSLLFSIFLSVAPLFFVLFLSWNVTWKPIGSPLLMDIFFLNYNQKTSKWKSFLVTAQKWRNRLDILATSSIALLPFFFYFKYFRRLVLFFREIKKKKSQATKGDCIMATPTIKKIDVKFRHFWFPSFPPCCLSLFFLSACNLRLIQQLNDRLWERETEGGIKKSGKEIPSRSTLAHSR